MTFKPYVGLSEDQLEKIVKNIRPYTERIEKITGVPKEAMEAINYRENSSRLTNPSTPGGPWQFDPIPSPDKVDYLLQRFTSLTKKERNEIIVKGVNDFFAGGVIAACFLRTKTGPVIHPQVEDDVIMDALYGYNGRAYGDATNSPYVYNGYDKEHYRLRVRGSVPDGKGGRRIVNNPDTRPGAFVVYKQLKTAGNKKELTIIDMIIELLLKLKNQLQGEY